MFTGKTYGLKIMEYGKPLLQRWWVGREDRKRVVTMQVTQIWTANIDCNPKLRP